MTEVFSKLKATLYYSYILSTVVLTGCAGSRHQMMEPDLYRIAEIKQDNRLAYDISGQQTKNTLDYSRILRDVERRAGQLESSINNPLRGRVIQSRYGYSMDVLPVFQFYQSGQFDKALAYNSFLYSETVVNQQDNPPKLANSLGYLGQLETAQLLLDNGYTESAAEVSLPILLNASSKNGNEPFEDIQGINNRIIAEALNGDARFINDAKRVNVFQYEQYLKYKAELEEAQKEIDPTDVQSMGVANKVGQLFKTEGYQKSLVLAKTVSSPYVNSTADFLTAYANEHSYVEDTLNNEPSDWNSVSLSLSHVEKNVIDKNTFQVVTKEVAQKPDQSDYKVVYVLTGTDIVPVKEISYTKIPLILGGTAVSFSNVNLVPVDKTVHSVSVLTESGLQRPLAKIASPEAYIAKSYIDHYNVILFKQAAKAIATVTMAKTANEAVKNQSNDDDDNQFIGQLLGAVASHAVSAVGDRLSLPSTEGWQSMPANIYATRVVVPKDTNSMTIRINGGSAEQKVALNNNNVNFVYARAIGNNITAMSSKSMSSAEE